MESMLNHHRRIVNAEAHAVSATTNGHTRASRTIGPTALDPDGEGVAEEEEFDGALDLGADVWPAVPEGFCEALFDEAPEGAPEGVPEGALEAELGSADAELAPLEPPVVLLVVSKVGGPTAVEGSTSAPLPNPTVVPSDAFSVCVGWVVEPSAPAMVNRVVQVTLGVPPEVNW
jgi:hypothetical protein